MLRMTFPLSPLSIAFLFLVSLTMAVSCGKKDDKGDDGPAAPSITQEQTDQFKKLCGEAGGKVSATGTDEAAQSCDCGAEQITPAGFFAEYHPKDNTGANFKYFCNQKVTALRNTQNAAAITAACTVLKRDCQALASAGAKFAENQTPANTSCQCGSTTVTCGQFDNQTFFGNDGGNFKKACQDAINKPATPTTTATVQQAQTAFRTACQSKASQGARFTAATNNQPDSCTCGNWPVTLDTFRTTGENWGFNIDKTGAAFGAACLSRTTSTQQGQCQCGKFNSNNLWYCGYQANGQLIGSAYGAFQSEALDNYKCDMQSAEQNLCRSLSVPQGCQAPTTTTPTTGACTCSVFQYSGNSYCGYHRNNQSAGGTMYGPISDPQNLNGWKCNNSTAADDLCSTITKPSGC